jgi:biotin carboxylase
MRRIFREQGIPSPDFAVVEPDAVPDLAAIRRLRLPVVVKPIDNMGARGVRRLDGWAELEEALADARGFSRHGAVLVEEFISGPEYSIDSLVVGGRLVPCGLALRHVRFPPFFIEVGHTLPSDLAPDQAQSLVDVFARAVAALGITTGAAKGDVFMTSRGPMIGEIAARLSGGYMSGWTFPLASGLELTRAGLYLAMGLPLPSLDPLLDRVSAERAVISIPGKVAAWENLEPALADDAVMHWFSRARPGDRVVFPRNNVEKAGNVIAVAPERQAACQAAERAIAACFLRLEPGQADTDAYLFQPRPGQHRAYPGLAACLPAGLAWRNSLASLEGRPDLLAETDWSWRSLRDSLAWLDASSAAGFLAAAAAGSLDRFWLALANGGLQGAVYWLDGQTGGRTA